jgi:hypothetical protein
MPQTGQILFLIIVSCENFFLALWEKTAPSLKVKWSLTCDSLNNDCLTTDPTCIKDFSDHVAA